MTTHPAPAHSDDALAQVAEVYPLRRRWIVYGIVSATLFMMAVDQTAVATALSAVQNDMNTSLAVASWTVSGYAVGQIVAFPLGGLLADQYGRKTVFLVAIAMFTV